MEIFPHWGCVWMTQFNIKISSVEQLRETGISVGQVVCFCTLELKVRVLLLSQNKTPDCKPRHISGINTFQICNFPLLWWSCLNCHTFSESRTNVSSLLEICFPTNTIYLAAIQTHRRPKKNPPEIIPKRSVKFFMKKKESWTTGR